MITKQMRSKYLYIHHSFNKPLISPDFNLLFSISRKIHYLMLNEKNQKENGMETNNYKVISHANNVDLSSEHIQE